MIVIDLRQVQAFVAVVEERSFTKAAGRLHIGQSGLSQQIKKLERALGGELFDRDSRTVDITPLGRDLYKPAQQLLAAAENFERSARPDSSKRTLTMAIAENGVNAIALEALSRVRDSFRDVDLEIRRVTLLDQHRALRDGVEAALTRPPFCEPLSSDFVGHVIRLDPVVVALHESDPAAHRASLTSDEVREMERVPLTWTPAPWGDLSDLLTADPNQPVPSNLVADTFRDAYATVSIHRVACVMPLSFAESYNVVDVKAVPISDIAPMRIELVVQRDSEDELIRRLAELLELEMVPDDVRTFDDSQAARR